MFFILVTIMAFLCFTFSIIAGFLVPKNLTLASKITRHPLGGGFLMMIALIWLVFAGADMLCLDRQSSIFSMSLVLAPFIGLLFTYFLDFLVTRALSTLCILLATTIIDLAFSQKIPYRGFCSIMCYLVVFCAFYWLIWPYALRNLWEKCASVRWIRYCCILVPVILGIGFGIFGCSFFFIGR